MDSTDVTPDPTFFPPITDAATLPAVEVSAARSPGEPISHPGAANSSRPRQGRWVAGLLAASMVSAIVGSVGTVGVLDRIGALGPAAAAAADSGKVVTASTGTSALAATDPVVAVAESASPAVVTITVDSTARAGFGPYSVPVTGVGSGFVFDAAGLILTNHHVIEGSDKITVTLQDGSELSGTVVADDSTHDLAVVKVDAKTVLPTIPIGKASALKVGEQVIAIGSPLGTFTESVTSGILSATGRTIEVGSETSRQTKSMSGLLQTDAAINSGNSGGPLLDASGSVIGVNVAVAQSAQGIGFAVPIDVAANIMAQARAKLGTA